MSNVEEKLEAAAAETRRLAATRTPEPLAQAQRGKPRGWLAFAAAFVVVIVTFGLIPLLTGGDESQPADDSTPMSSAPADTASTETTTTADVSCSAAGASVPSGSTELPEPVATTRQAIIDAAMACDLTALESLAAEGFTTSYGGGGIENLRIWEDEGTGQLDTLLDLFDTTHGTSEDGGIYVWPAAYVYESWEAIPADLVEELRQIHTDDELEMFSEFGSYAGWRTGIDEDGNWLYLVAGD